MLLLIALFLGDKPLQPHLPAEVPAWCRILRRRAIDREEFYMLVSFPATASKTIEYTSVLNLIAEQAPAHPGSP
jgi:hypothetical protein